MIETGTQQLLHLVPKAVHGDVEALSALLAFHGPQIERGLKIGRQWQAVLESGDVMQVTYLEAFLQISRFRPEEAQSFVPWLRRIAENNLRDAIRSLERQKQPPPNRQLVSSRDQTESFVYLYETIAATSSTPSRAMARKDVHRLLEAALERLPTDYATVIRLYDLEGRDIADVAATMQRSAGAVHMMRARAHERLGELLETAAVWFSSGA
jgi:RNA polymerase sigma-70 factor (ECF subfamily)